MSFLGSVLKNAQISKSVQWEPSCSMRTEGRTDMTKRRVAFRNFAKSALNMNALRSQRDSNWNIRRRKARVAVKSAGGVHVRDSGSVRGSVRTEISEQVADFIRSEEGNCRITLNVRIYAPNYKESYAKLSRSLLTCTFASTIFDTSVLFVY